MTSPVRASYTPFAVVVEQGKDCYWCACGQSKRHQFCDGSHQDGPFNPVKYSATASHNQRV